MKSSFADKLGCLPEIVAIVALAAVACGGDTPAPQSPASESTAAPRAPSKSSRMSVRSELGEIDSQQTESLFRSLQNRFGACHREGLSRVEYLGGDVRFFARIGADGRARYAYLEDSSLGDRATEKCMLDVLLGASWPMPEGGEAEVRKSIGFDPPGDVRPPTDWNSERVSHALSAASRALDSCKSGVSGKFRVTVYVAPEGKGGKVQAAGVASPSKEGEAIADCVVNALKDLKLPSPGSYAAKVRFQI